MWNELITNRGFTTQLLLLLVFERFVCVSFFYFKKETPTMTAQRRQLRCDCDPVCGRGPWKSYQSLAIYFFIFAVHALFNWINFAHLIKRVRSCVRAREHERQRFAVSRNRYVAEYWMCNEHGFKFQLVDLWILCAHSMFPVFVFFFLSRQNHDFASE